MPEAPRPKGWKPAKRNKPGVKIMTGPQNDAYAQGWARVFGSKRNGGVKR